MKFSSNFNNRQHQIAAFFKTVFTASEGAEEGQLIEDLSANLMAQTPDTNLFVFLAEDAEALLGAIVFSRLTYSDDDRSVFVLGPVAVATDHQGKGIGQALLRHGLDALKDAGIDIALTYGDPNYYAKVGFFPISESDAAAPFALQYPEGWLGQSLAGSAYLPIKGSCRCVQAFENPAYW